MYKRTNAQGNPLCILRVIVFFFSIKKNRWTGHVFCVFLYFFFRSVDTKPTCSMCFCVFLFINFYFSHNSDRGKHLMCSVCFCPKVSGHTTNVFCVFLCFFLPTFSLILVQTGTPTQCVWCVFVFFHKGLKSHHPCVLCVFVFLQRYQVTTPMYFVCFCVIFTNA